MSRLVVYVARADGDVVHYAEARNAFGGAAHTWNVLSKRLGIEDDDLRPMSSWPKLWAREAELGPVERWVLRSTYDQVVVPRADLAIYREAVGRFASAHPTPTLHELLEALDRALADADVLHVCFNQTTVAWPFWWVNSDDPDGDGRPYNILRDTGHWPINGDGALPSELPR